MNDKRAPEPYLCGDCKQLSYETEHLDELSFGRCSAHHIDLDWAGDESTLVGGGPRDFYRCSACIEATYAARATAAREWDEMSGAIAKQMMADACRARWIAGAMRYGQAWQSEERDNVHEAREELLDAINYLLAAGARGQLSAKHAQRFVEQVVDLLDRLYWVQAQAWRKVEEAGADGNHNA